MDKTKLVGELDDTFTKRAEQVGHAPFSQAVDARAECG